MAAVVEEGIIVGGTACGPHFMAPCAEERRVNFLLSVACIN
jgi:hypothetical protein